MKGSLQFLSGDNLEVKWNLDALRLVRAQAGSKYLGKVTCNSQAPSLQLRAVAGKDARLSRIPLKPWRKRVAPRAALRLAATYCSLIFLLLHPAYSCRTVARRTHYCTRSLLHDSPSTPEHKHNVPIPTTIALHSYSSHQSHKSPTLSSSLPN